MEIKTLRLTGDYEKDARDEILNGVVRRTGGQNEEDVADE